MVCRAQRIVAEFHLDCGVPFLDCWLVLTNNSHVVSLLCYTRISPYVGCQFGTSQCLDGWISSLAGETNLRYQSAKPHSANSAIVSCLLLSRFVVTYFKSSPHFSSFMLDVESGTFRGIQLFCVSNSAICVDSINTFLHRLGTCKLFLRGRWFLKLRA